MLAALDAHALAGREANGSGNPRIPATTAFGVRRDGVGHRAGDDAGQWFDDAGAWLQATDANQSGGGRPTVDAGHGAEVRSLGVLG
jgi:hypothetical protein